MSATDTDADELARARREISALQAELHARDDSYRAFAYSVSHDLRAPLRAIAGFSEILQEGLHDDGDAETHRFLAIIRDNVRLLNNQIDGLLEISRIERRELRPSVVDMTALARAVVDEMREHEPTRRVAAHVATLPAVVADPDLMRRVLFELVRNAWKFTRTRGEAHVEIGGECRDGAAVYFVRDDGVGFGPGSADRLFVVFRRLHREKDYEGLGLGLAVVQAIVARHRGRAWAECAPEVPATTVRFTVATDLQPE